MLGDTVKNEKDTKSKLLASAKQEFMEKGYMQASLRNICKNAGVTTGALYFFFKDKEDLFASLVEEPLNTLKEIMNSHYTEEMEYVTAIHQMKNDFTDDMEAVEELLHYIYQHYEEFQLVLTKSQGSRFEKSVDFFVAVTEKHYRLLTDKISEIIKAPVLNDYMVHWISHMQIDIFVHLLTHERSEAAAREHMILTMNYLMNGWNGFFVVPDNNKE